MRGPVYSRDCMRFTCIAEYAGKVMRREEKRKLREKNRTERDNDSDRRREAERERGRARARERGEVGGE